MPRLTTAVGAMTVGLLGAGALAGCCCQPVTYSVATYAVPYDYAYTYRRAPAPGATTPVAVVQPVAPYAVVPPNRGCGLSVCASPTSP